MTNHRTNNDMILAINAHVGKRLHAARLQKKISQSAAARHVEVTFQQIQKYERGKNRVSAGTMAMLAELYGVSIMWLFEGSPSIAAPAAGDDISAKLLAMPAGREIIQHCSAIRDSADRRMVAALAERMARGKSLVPAGGE